MGITEVTVPKQFVIVQATEPTGAFEGQIWVDTGVTPSATKQYKSEEWVSISTDYSNYIDALTLQNANQQVEILELQASANVTPLSADTIIGDFFNSASGLRGTVDTGNTTATHIGTSYSTQLTQNFATSGTTNSDVYGANKQAQAITLGSETTLLGLIIYINTKNGSPPNLVLKLLDSGFSLVTGTQITKTADQVTASANNSFYFDTPVTVPAGTYYISAEAESAGGDASNKYACYYAGSGNGRYYWNGSSWISNNPNQARHGYIYGPGADGVVIVDLGDLSGKTITDLTVVANKTGTIDYEYDFDTGTYSSAQTIGDVLSGLSIEGGATGNYIKFNLSGISTIDGYAVGIFYD